MTSCSARAPGWRRLALRQPWHCAPVRPGRHDSTRSWAWRSSSPRCGWPGLDEAPMTPLVRRYLRTAIGFLLAGLGLGAWMLVRRELAGQYPTPRLISAHTHVILVGFVMMMILGVALWMFPRPEREDVRYRPGVAEAAYW